VQRSPTRLIEFDILMLGFALLSTNLHLFFSSALSADFYAAYMEQLLAEID